MVNKTAIIVVESVYSCIGRACTGRLCRRWVSSGVNCTVLNSRCTCSAHCVESQGKTRQNRTCASVSLAGTVRIESSVVALCLMTRNVGGNR